MVNVPYVQRVEKQHLSNAVPDIARRFPATASETDHEPAPTQGSQQAFSSTLGISTDVTICFSPSPMDRGWLKDVESHVLQKLKRELHIADIGTETVNTRRLLGFISWTTTSTSQQ